MIKSVTHGSITLFLQFSKDTHGQALAKMFENMRVILLDIVWEIVNLVTNFDYMKDKTLSFLEKCNHGIFKPYLINSFLPRLILRVIRI